MTTSRRDYRGWDLLTRSAASDLRPPAFTTGRTTRVRFDPKSRSRLERVESRVCHLRRLRQGGGRASSTSTASRPRRRSTRDKLDRARSQTRRARCWSAAGTPGAPFKGIDRRRADLRPGATRRTRSTQLAVHRHRIAQILSRCTDKRTTERSGAGSRVFPGRSTHQTLRTVQRRARALYAEATELDNADPDRDGDAGDGEAARDVRARPRRLRQADGDKVTPGVPAVLPPLPDGAPRNRLALARWLVSPTHPLTARVAVNRYWQMLLRHGPGQDRRGLRLAGRAARHPELLDWLATEFVRTGWDVKALQRLIVTSATYRQSSTSDARAAANRSGEPAARARPALPAAGRDRSATRPWPSAAC